MGSTIAIGIALKQAQDIRAHSQKTQ